MYRNTDFVTLCHMLLLKVRNVPKQTPRRRVLTKHVGIQITKTLSKQKCLCKNLGNKALEK